MNTKRFIYYRKSVLHQLKYIFVFTEEMQYKFSVELYYIKPANSNTTSLRGCMIWSPSRPFQDNTRYSRKLISSYTGVQST